MRPEGHLCVLSGNPRALRGDPCALRGNLRGFAGKRHAQDALHSNVPEPSAGSEGTQFWSNSGSADHFSQMTQTIFPA